MADVQILLTFDDGPHAAALDRKTRDKKQFLNRTQRVLDSLMAESIRAAFFIQTHAPGRLQEGAGREVVKRAYDQEHSIQIHTGSPGDHTLHPVRVKAAAYDSDGDGQIDGANALESDLKRAKLAIAAATGGPVPGFVRAPEGKGFRDQPVRQAYENLTLKHIFWDVDSYDSGKPRPNAAKVKSGLRGCVRARVDSGFSKLIILFHDINGVTTELTNLRDYIAEIRGAVTDAGKTPVFTSSRVEVEALMGAWTEPATTVPAACMRTANLVAAIESIGSLWLDVPTIQKNNPIRSSGAHGDGW